jgi:hypothetical protein
VTCGESNTQQVVRALFIRPLVVVGASGEHIQVLEQVHADQFQHLEPDSTQRAPERVFPSVFFAARMAFFHA